MQTNPIFAWLILFSNVWGFFFKEWAGADKKPKRILHLEKRLIIVACVLITRGNSLGNSAAAGP